MIVALLLVALVSAISIELVGALRGKQGKTDTYSELWWWLTSRLPRPLLFAVNGAMAGFLVWAAVHLTTRAV